MCRCRSGFKQEFRPQGSFTSGGMHHLDPFRSQRTCPSHAVCLKSCRRWSRVWCLFNTLCTFVIFQCSLFLFRRRFFVLLLSTCAALLSAEECSRAQGTFTFTLSPFSPVTSELLTSRETRRVLLSHIKLLELVDWRRLILDCLISILC